MTRSTLAAALLALTVFAGACDDNDPTGPTPGGNDIPNPRFTAALLASNEVPPITNQESGATGNATITINATRDSAGAIIAATVDFQVTLANFPAGSAVTIAHIHPGAAGTTGGILVNTGLTSGEVSLVNGAGSFTKNGVPVGVTEANAIIANPAGYYFNVHSAANPGGVVRGQLVRTN